MKRVTDLPEKTNVESTDSRPLILLTNDDGIEAPGLAALTEALHPLGKLVIVAPRYEQSGVSQAITVRDPIRVEEWPYQTSYGPVTAHSVTGTPADCVKFALYDLLEHPPDLVVSGINQGPNAAINVLYSGTVAAAIEATVSGHQAMAVSLDNWNSDADFSGSASVAAALTEKVLGEPLPERVFLNVNVPSIPTNQIKGVRITRQAHSRWEESFSLREDPGKRPYYWLAGYFVNLDKGPGTDLEAMEAGYVAITPTKLDMTSYETIKALSHWPADVVRF